MRFVYRPDHPQANENGMVPADIAPPKNSRSTGITLIRDIEPYQSPIDGRSVGSRRERREDLKRSGCVEWEPTFPGNEIVGLTSAPVSGCHCILGSSNTSKMYFTALLFSRDDKCVHASQHL